MAWLWLAIGARPRRRSTSALDDQASETRRGRNWTGLSTNAPTLVAGQQGEALRTGRYRRRRARSRLGLTRWFARQCPCRARKWEYGPRARKEM